MIIETDMKQETLFEVLTFDGDATLGFIKAYDVPHARRIAERLYCKGVKIKLIGEGSKEIARHAIVRGETTLRLLNRLPASRLAIKIQQRRIKRL